MGFAAAASAALSYYNTELGRYAMVSAGIFENWVTKRRRERFDNAVAAGVAATIDAAVAKGEARATAEINARWLAREARREEAEARNEPFDEPPPV